MTTIANLATLCAQDLVNLVSGVDGLETRVWHIYSEDELQAKHKGMIFPCVGIVYDGIRVVETGSNGGAATSANVNFTLVLYLRINAQAVEDPLNSGVAQIDAVREAILKKRSPTGHFWKFQAEVSVAGGKSSVAYVQRWQTAVQLS